VRKDATMGPLGFIVRNFGAIYALVMTAIHAAEEAPTDGPAKRQAAVTAISSSLSSIFNLTGKVHDAVTNVLGGMIDVYVGVRNVLEGHGWFGTSADTKASAPQIADAAGPTAQATQLIRQTDVSAPSSTPATKPTQPDPQPSKS